MKLKELHQQFLEHLEVEKGRSLKTVENYDRYVKRFLDFAKITEPKEISEEMLRKYRLWLNRIVLKNGNNLNKKTQNYYLIALRAFLKYLAKRSIASLPPDKIELAKTPQRELDLITAEELQRLLDAPIKGSGGRKRASLRTDEEGNSTEASFSSSASELVGKILLRRPALRSLRDKAILELLFSTGLRVSELCALNRDSFNEAKSGEISIRGKGGKIRVVFISESAKQAVKNYLDKRADTEEALFVSVAPPSRLTPRSIERMIKQRAVEAGISKKSPAYHPPLFCHRPALQRRRPPFRPSPPRSLQHRHHPNLHPRDGQAIERHS